MNLKEFDIGVIEEIMDSLPVDLSFVDEEDRVKFFNTPKGKPRIFPRTKMDLGRKVQNCHPPQSLDKVNAILEGFKNGMRKDAAFWINLKGRQIYINYFPVTDKEGKYLGTLEVTQDITDIKKIEGEKRLLDE